MAPSHFSKPPEGWASCCRQVPGGGGGACSLLEVVAQGAAGPAMERPPPAGWPPGMVSCPPGPSFSQGLTRGPCSGPAAEEPPVSPGFFSPHQCLPEPPQINGLPPILGLGCSWGCRPVMPQLPGHLPARSALPHSVLSGALLCAGGAPGGGAGCPRGKFLEFPRWPGGLALGSGPDRVGWVSSADSSLPDVTPGPQPAHLQWHRAWQVPPSPGSWDGATSDPRGSSPRAWRGRRCDGEAGEAAGPPTGEATRPPQVGQLDPLQVRQLGLREAKCCIRGHSGPLSSALLLPRSCSS